MALPAGATVQQKLAAARAYLTTLELTRKAEHPDVIRAKRVIADLEKQEAAESRQSSLAARQQNRRRP